MSAVICFHETLYLSYEITVYYVFHIERKWETFIMFQYTNRVLSKFICWGICPVYYRPYRTVLCI